MKVLSVIPVGIRVAIAIEDMYVKIKPIIIGLSKYDLIHVARSGKAFEVINLSSSNGKSHMGSAFFKANFDAGTIRRINSVAKKEVKKTLAELKANAPPMFRPR